VEVTGMFRLAVDTCNVRENEMETNGNLWKLLLMYRTEQNVIEWKEEKEIGDMLWSHRVTVVTVSGCSCQVTMKMAWWATVICGADEADGDERKGKCECVHHDAPGQHKLQINGN